MINKLLSLLFKSYRLYSSGCDLLKSLNNIHTVWNHQVYDKRLNMILHFISYEPENLIWLNKNNNYNDNGIRHFLIDNEPLTCFSYNNVNLQYQFRRSNTINQMLFIDDYTNDDSWNNQNLNYIYSYDLKKIVNIIINLFPQFKEQLLKIESLLMLEVLQV